MNSRDDYRYRSGLAEGFLKEAEEDLTLKRFRSCVDNSQLAVENAAKAVIALFGPVGKMHDVGPHLEALLDSAVTDEAKSMLSDLIDRTERLGFREHILSDYGDEDRGILPWDLFDGKDASMALDTARDAVRIAVAIAGIHLS